MTEKQRLLCRRLHTYTTLLGLMLIDFVLSLSTTILWGSPGALFVPKSRHGSRASSTGALYANQRTNLLLESGKSATIRSRLVPLTNTWNVTIWEWDEPSAVMEHYWASQQDFVSRKHLLDPFGLVAWPGSVVAAQEMIKYQQEIENTTVLILGAGPGVEAQAVAMLGARRVIATDIHPTTLQLLRYGAQEAGLGSIVHGQGVS